MTSLNLNQRLFGRGQQPPDVPEDDPMARLVARSVALDPDPLFRRRLRGRILNQHVAVHEGLVAAPPAPRMGRLGRGVLVGSLALALSVGGVGAASQSALPGDSLYPIKLELEAIRMAVAPASMRASLRLAAFDERLEEVERLAAADRWSDLAAAADAVGAARGELIAAPADVDAGVHRHAAVLQELLSGAPEAGRPGLQRALAASQTQGRTDNATHPSRPGAPADGSAPDNRNQAVAPNHTSSNGQTPAVGPSATPRASRVEEPGRSPRPTASAPNASDFVGSGG